MFLGGNVRSKCCHAVVRLGHKKLKRSDIKVKIWICTACQTRDVDILTLDQIRSQLDNDKITHDEGAL